MSITVGAMVLVAALVHAAWNAILRGTRDRVQLLILMQLTTLIVATSLIPFVAIPSPHSWPWLIGGAVLHACYRASLIWAFNHGELGEIYPISRGASPTLVTFGAAVVTHDKLGFMSILGIALVSIGVLALRTSGRRRLPNIAVVAALITATFTASYTVVDGYGARLSGDAIAFAVWLFAIGGLATLIAALASVRLRTLTIDRTFIGRAVLCGMLSMLSYGLVIFASTLGPLGVISALRETSIIFAVFIGSVFLGETMTGRRVFASAIVMCGCVCFAF